MKLPLLAAIVLVAALLGAFAAYSLWQAVALCLAGIYMLFAVVCWELSARIAAVALLIYPLASVLPLLGPRYVLLAGLIVLIVGLAGIVTQRDIDVRHAGPALAFEVWLLACAVHTLIVAAWLPDGPWVLLIVPVTSLGATMLVASGAARLRRLLILGIVAVGAVEALIALSQQFTGKPVFAVFGNPVYEQARNYLSIVAPRLTSVAHMSSGTFEHFNTLGAYMCMVVPIAFWMWLTTRRWVTFGVLVIVTAGLVATFSRGALGGTACGVVVAFLWAAQRRTAVARVLVVTAAILAFALIAAPRLATFWKPTNNLGIRVVLWQRATSGLGSDALLAVLGRGYGHLEIQLIEAGNANLRVHSGFVQILVEAGILGLTLFVGAVVVALRAGWQRRVEMAGVAGAVVAFLVASSVDNALLSPIGAVWAGLLVLLATTGGCGSRSNPRRLHEDHVGISNSERLPLSRAKGGEVR